MNLVSSHAFRFLSTHLIDPSFSCDRALQSNLACFEVWFALSLRTIASTEFLFTLQCIKYSKIASDSDEDRLLQFLSLSLCVINLQCECEYEYMMETHKKMKPSRQPQTVNKPHISFPTSMNFTLCW